MGVQRVSPRESKGDGVGEQGQIWPEVFQPISILWAQKSVLAQSPHIGRRRLGGIGVENGRLERHILRNIPTQGGSL